MYSFDSFAIIYWFISRHVVDEPVTARTLSHLVQKNDICMDALDSLIFLIIMSMMPNSNSFVSRSSMFYAFKDLLFLTDVVTWQCFFFLNSYNTCFETIRITGEWQQLSLLTRRRIYSRKTKNRLVIFAFNSHGTNSYNNGINITKRCTRPWISTNRSDEVKLQSIVTTKKSIKLGRFWVLFHMTLYCTFSPPNFLL